MDITNLQTGLRSALLAGVLALAAPAGAEPIGFLAVVEGDVQVQRAGGGGFAAAAVDLDVEIGDTIRTGRDALAKLVLVDDTVLTVDEETELEIDHYVVGSAASSEPSRINLLGGHVRTRVGEAFGGPTRLEMHTPTAVIGVKGTEWLTWYLRQLRTTIVCVVSGVVTVENPAVTGIQEPPIGTCSEVLPEARPAPVEFPAQLGGLGNVRGQTASSPPALPPVGAGPGGDLPDVGQVINAAEPLDGTQDALGVDPDQGDPLREAASTMMESMDSMDPGSGFPGPGGPGSGSGEGFPGAGGPGSGSGGEPLP